MYFIIFFCFCIFYKCSNAYVDVDGVTHIEDGFALGADYYELNLPIVERQLARAGVRLANVLNSIFPTDEKRAYTIATQ